MNTSTALSAPRIIEVSPLMKGPGVGTRVLELKRCTNCGAVEQPMIEPKGHACSCHANGKTSDDWHINPAMVAAQRKGFAEGRRLSLSGLRVARY